MAETIADISVSILSVPCWYANQSIAAGTTENAAASATVPRVEVTLPHVVLPSLEEA